MIIRFIFLLLLLCNSLVFAQGVSSNIVYPLALNKGGTELSNVVTNVATTGTLNNLALTTSVLRFAGGSAQTVTGIVSAAKAQRVTLINLNSSSYLYLNHESASSTAANRLSLPGNAQYTVPYNSSIQLVYDTVSSRWRVTTETIRAQLPLYKTADSIYVYQATTGQNGYLSSSDYNTYLDNWKQTGQDIYQTNTNNVWISLYNCATLTTYSTCSAQAQCTVNRTANCSAFGDQSSCETVSGGGCTWDSGVGPCTGTYFQSGDCSGNYNYDDGTNSKLQVKATVQCSGDSNACSTYNADSGQCAIQGCSFTSNTCPSYSDESSCNSNSPCTWTNSPQSCSVYTGDYGACTSTSGCSWNECSSYSGDESTCVNADPACWWSVTPCSTYNGDQYSCENYTSGQCYYSDPNCEGAGVNGSCSGTWCSGSYDSYSCGGDNGGCLGTPYTCASKTTSGTCTPVLPCAWTTTPAGRFQGDLIATSDGYLEFEKTSAGAPTSGDCDADAERGRLVIDTTNNWLYICNGASRGWDYVALTN